MDNLDQVVEALCRGMQGLSPAPASIHFDRTNRDWATVTAEYDHQVFEIRVDAGRRAPRVPLPIEEIVLGTHDNVEVHLTPAVVGPDVTITLEGRGAEADRLVQRPRGTRGLGRTDATHPDTTTTVARRADRGTQP